LCLPYRTTCGKCGARRIDRQIGLEQAADCAGWATGVPCGACYVCRLVAVFREVKRVLHDTGVCWVNLGDSYNNAKAGNTNGSDGSGLKRNVKDEAARQRCLAENKIARSDSFGKELTPGLAPKNLLMTPFRVALALQADGWILRSCCPWVKRSAMPESVQDRPATSLEYVFLLSKRGRYFWDAEAVRRQALSADREYRADRSVPYAGGTAPHIQPYSTGPSGYGVSSAGRSFRNSDLWFDSVGLLLSGTGDPLGFDVTPAGFPGAHFATMPPLLVQPMVAAGTSERGCCAACGAPWRRRMEREYVANPGHKWGHRGDAPRDPGNRSGHAFDESRLPVARTVGWRPSCACPAAEPVPSVVLDPFAGAGTVLLVARLMGRRALGCELSEPYAQMARRRIAAGLDWRPERNGNGNGSPSLYDLAEE